MAPAAGRRRHGRPANIGSLAVPFARERNVIVQCLCSVCCTLQKNALSALSTKCYVENGGFIITNTRLYKTKHEKNSH